MRTRFFWIWAFGLGVTACGSTSVSGGGSGGPVAPGVSEGCGSVRLTNYTAAKTGWCEFDRTLSILPASVVSGLTTAIAEPYNGSSYDGEPGESCGECWEIDTLTGTKTVMVHDLCPIEGNPLCAGGHFHFDLSSESANALQAGGLDEAQVRRVPCPVNGYINLQISDWNEWGYLRFAVVNHLIPVRTVEYRSASGSTWLSAQRSGGAWQIMNGANSDMFAKGKPGGIFRITSAQGQSVESPNPLIYTTGVPVGGSALFDLGVQLTDQTPDSGSACVFEPPAVYTDSYGGIPEVYWKMNPWNGADPSETTQGCYSGSCILVQGLGSGKGFHIYYVHEFSTSIFKTLKLRLRAPVNGTSVHIGPSNGGTLCQVQPVTVGTDWSEVSVDLAAACTNLTTIDSVTLDESSSSSLLLDDIRFEK